MAVTVVLLWRRRVYKHGRSPASELPHFLSKFPGAGALALAQHSEVDLTRHG